MRYAQIGLGLALAAQGLLAANTVTATWKVTSDWGTGCNAAVKIVNHATWSLPDWKLAMDFGTNQLTGLWDASVIDSSGSRYTMSMIKADWASPDLAAGDSVTFSLGLDPSCPEPTGVTLNGKAITWGAEVAAPAALQPVAAPVWPASFVAPYVDVGLYPTLDLVATAQRSGLRHFTLAFVVAQESTVPKPSWGTYYSTSSGFLLSQINTLRQMGGDVMVSFGGAANTELSGSTTNVDTLVEAYDAVVKTYGFTKIDFDIEGTWVADKASIARRSGVLAKLQARWKTQGRTVAIWYTLPVLPDGLDNNGLAVLKSALDSGVVLEGVNVMAMDYGDVVAPHPADSMGSYAINAAKGLFTQLKGQHDAHGIAKTDAQLWAMVGITPMIGLNDVLTERFTIANAQQVAAFAKANRIGMLSFWSMNRDAPCNKANSQVELGCSSVTQDSLQFAKTFLELETANTTSTASRPVPTGSLPTLHRRGVHLVLSGSLPGRLGWQGIDEQGRIRSSGVFAGGQAKILEISQLQGATLLRIQGGNALRIPPP